MTLQIPNHNFLLWPNVLPSLGANPFVGSAGNPVPDASGEYFGMAIYAFEDMAISHVGVKMHAVSGSPTIDLRVETIDAATGLPTGTLWATNTNIVTGTLTTSWTVHALTATANITKGSWFFIKYLYNSGTSFTPAAISGGIAELQFNYGVTNTGTPTKNAFITPISLGSSSTDMYYIGGGYGPYSGNSTLSINNSNGARSGMRFQVPFKCEAHGLATFHLTNDADLVLYDDAGSAISGASASWDASAAGPGSNIVRSVGVFTTPATLDVNTWYRAAVVPTSGSNCSPRTFNVDSVDMLSGCPGRGFARRTDYTTAGGWSETNAAALPLMDLIIRRLDDGAGGGGGASFSAYAM